MHRNNSTWGAHSYILITSFPSSVHIHIHTMSDFQGHSCPKMKGTPDTYEKKYHRISPSVTASDPDTPLISVCLTDVWLKVYINPYVALQIFRLETPLGQHTEAAFTTTGLVWTLLKDFTGMTGHSKQHSDFFFSRIHVNQRTFKAERRQWRVPKAAIATQRKWQITF